MNYNNISACILSSHHTHGKKDLNKQFSHSEKHTPMLEREVSDCLTGQLHSEGHKTHLLRTVCLTQTQMKGRGQAGK